MTNLRLVEALARAATYTPPPSPPWYAGFIYSPFSLVWICRSWFWEWRREVDELAWESFADEQRTGHFQRSRRPQSLITKRAVSAFAQKTVNSRLFTRMYLRP